jgi:hypothetical protein
MESPCVYLLLTQARNSAGQALWNERAERGVGLSAKGSALPGLLGRA